MHIQPEFILLAVSKLLLCYAVDVCPAAAMELVAMELKQSGSFIARTLSYEVTKPLLTPRCMHVRCLSCACALSAVLTQMTSIVALQSTV